MEKGERLSILSECAERLWRATQLTDVVLLSDGPEFSVHRLVLAAYSKVLFSELVSSHATTPGTTTINMLRYGISGETLDTLLTFIYTGNLPAMSIYSKQKAALLRAACILQIPSLVSILHSLVENVEIKAEPLDDNHTTQTAEQSYEELLQGLVSSNVQDTDTPSSVVPVLPLVAVSGSSALLSLADPDGLPGDSSLGDQRDHGMGSVEVEQSPEGNRNTSRRSPRNRVRVTAPSTTSTPTRSAGQTTRSAGQNSRTAGRGRKRQSTASTPTNKSLDLDSSTKQETETASAVSTPVEYTYTTLCGRKKKNPPLSTCERQRRYRERRIAIEGEAFLTAERSRARNYYTPAHKLSAAELEKARAESRVRVRRYRAKQNQHCQRGEGNQNLIDTAKSSAKASQKKYRARRKVNEQVSYLQGESERVKKYYLPTNKMTAEQLQKFRTENREKARKYRARQKQPVKQQQEGGQNVNDCDVTLNNLPPNRNRKKTDKNSTSILGKVVLFRQLTKNARLPAQNPKETNKRKQKKSILSNAERQRTYRQRKKQREGESYLEKERERVKNYGLMNPPDIHDKGTTLGVSSFIETELKHSLLEDETVLLSAKDKVHGDDVSCVNEQPNASSILEQSETGERCDVIPELLIINTANISKVGVGIFPTL